jgi:hypothetical protein
MVRTDHGVSHCSPLLCALPAHGPHVVSASISLAAPPRLAEAHPLGGPVEADDDYLVGEPLPPVEAREPFGKGGGPVRVGGGVDGWAGGPDEPADRGGVGGRGHVQAEGQSEGDKAVQGENG